MTDFSAEYQQLLDSVPAPANARISETVVAYEHDGQPMEGFAVHDEAVAGPKAAVLVVHDWTGLREYPKARAHMLARLGYYAFCVDVYGTGRRFDNPQDAGAEAGKYYGDLELLRARVRAAYDEAVKSPAVDRDRIAVMGYCFGGSAALEFARTGAPLKGTVSFHGRLVTHEPADVAAITGSVLVLTGGADPVVPDSAVAAFQDELRTRDDLDWQVTTYAGAEHGYTIPGEVYHPTADRRSWRQFTDFLAEVL
ncbi:dienelactone hydrolase family protein [Dactylosporangium vinaceum]|uniref:Dienelactone hydrolase family protein n=1 Tax=Dactylosporangium vinaceum TaxID=53362 RepID=A0ABV5M9X6_9ACTN|nr:dienelactone hydrolase family protein [Dactylosporangium vinaceum]UAB93167.1 dienelactone hydrolase family protein [Dactylosporangium vinaceum]